MKMNITLEQIYLTKILLLKNTLKISIIRDGQLKNILKQ